MDWKRIPSLSALRAFEATARHGGFSAAARELNVTHAAVAQHVRALEADFGVALVSRSAQGMALTRDGRALAEQLAEAFGTIASAVDLLRSQQEERPVRVTLTPAFAEAWLVPRLGIFWQEHPEIEVALHPSTASVDLKRGDHDLAIRFGTGDWPGLCSVPLLGSRYVLVAPPDYANGAGTLEELGDPSRHCWFFAAAAREQQVWGAALGLDFTQIPFQDMQSNPVALAAVRAGLGLSIQSRKIVEKDLADGRLIALAEGEDAGLQYYMVTTEAPRPRNVDRFMKWLVAEAARD
jgi:LysR family glycine cleavage system transcriptional activator